MNQALKTVLPVKQKVREAPKRKIHLLADAPALEEAIQTAERKNHKARLRLLYALKENPDIPYENTLHKLKPDSSSRPAVRTGRTSCNPDSRSVPQSFRADAPPLTDTSKAQWETPVLNEDQRKIRR